MFAKPDSALLIVGHGSTVNPDSSAPTLDHAAHLARMGVFGEVHCAFWKEEPSLRQALYPIDRDEIYVVPNFISEGYFTKTVIPRELELTGPLTQRGGRIVKYCEPTGSHAKMTDLLLRRAAEVAPGVQPSESCLIIAGHGTDLNENSAVAAKREVEKIRDRGVFAEVLSAYMEEAPRISDWDGLTNQPNVIVVPFFISDGLHSYQDIPVLLGIAPEPSPAASEMKVFRENPHRLRGRALYYANAIGTEPLFAEVILDQAAAFDLEHALAAT
jgi:sirohydrochlorin cobaltochelatase